MERDAEKLLMVQAPREGRKGIQEAAQMKRKDLNWLQHVCS